MRAQRLAHATRPHPPHGRVAAGWRPAVGGSRRQRALPPSHPSYCRPQSVAHKNSWVTVMKGKGKIQTVQVNAGRLSGHAYDGGRCHGSSAGEGQSTEARAMQRSKQGKVVKQGAVEVVVASVFSSGT